MTTVVPTSSLGGTVGGRFKFSALDFGLRAPHAIRKDIRCTILVEFSKCPPTSIVEAGKVTILANTC